MSFKKILCPVDFSSGAHAALMEALDVARLSRGDVTLLHVYAPPIELDAGPTWAASGLRQSLEESLSSWKTEAGASAVPVSACLTCGDPATEILRFAEEAGYDIIVMGTHGRTGLRRLVLGSVAERVVRSASVPVLTIHAPRESKHEATGDATAT